MITLERNCKGCGSKHTGVCGVRCATQKFILSAGMGLISGYDISSAEYLKAIEDELSQQRVTRASLEYEVNQYKSDQASGTTKDIKDPALMAALQLITDRLASLEAAVPNVSTPAPGVPPPANLLPANPPMANLPPAASPNNPTPPNKQHTNDGGSFSESCSGPQQPINCSPSTNRFY